MGPRNERLVGQHQPDGQRYGSIEAGLPPVCYELRDVIFCRIRDSFIVHLVSALSEPGLLQAHPCRSSGALKFTVIHRARAAGPVGRVVAYEPECEPVVLVHAFEMHPPDLHRSIAPSA